MNIIVPFTKEVKFDQALGDILSISLEHEYNLSNGILLGNFVVSGTYKSHELSVNKLEFTKTLAFDLSLSDAIDEDTLEFNIDNFTYEVLEGDILKVDIDYLVKAKELIREELKEETPIDSIFEHKDDNMFDLISDDILEPNRNLEIEKLIEDESLDFLEEFINTENEENSIKDKPKEIIDTMDELESLIDEVINNENIIEEKIDTSIKADINIQTYKEEIIEEKEEKEVRKSVDEETILNFASENKESFITYKVHLVKEGETIETICRLYSKSENDLVEYNIGIPFNPGDKILVPEDDE